MFNINRYLIHFKCLIHTRRIIKKIFDKIRSGIQSRTVGRYNRNHRVNAQTFRIKSGFGHACGIAGINADGIFFSGIIRIIINQVIFKKILIKVFR